MPHATAPTPDLLSELQKLDLTDPASFMKMFPEGTVEERDGKHYRISIPSRRVNTSYSREDVFLYLQEASKRMSRVSAWKGNMPYTPHVTIYDYVCTLRQLSAIGGIFPWPSNKLRYMKTVAVALQHLVPGYMYGVASAKAVPTRFFRPGTTDLKDSVRECYHGCSPLGLEYILGHGFSPVFGAGADATMKVFGLPIPGIHWALSLVTAMLYPIIPDTGPLPGHRKGIGGFQRAALDYSPGFRVALRSLYDLEDRFWDKEKKNVMSQFFGPMGSEHSPTSSFMRVPTKWSSSARTTLTSVW